MKNYLKIFIIIIFSTVIFGIGISKASAETTFHEYDIYDIDLTHIPTSPDATDRYAIIYGHRVDDITYDEQNNSVINYYLFMYSIRNNSNGLRFEYFNQPTYNNDICLGYEYNGENGCFSTIWSDTNSPASYRFYYSWYSDDLGATWNRISGVSNAYNQTITGYVITNTVDIYKNGVVVYPAGYELDLQKNFRITYEQGEVIMSNYENASANLVSQYIETDLNPQNYTFSYYYNTGGGLQNVIYEPICSETLVDDHIHYSCYYNIPLFYNTILTFNIDDKSTSDSVYSFIYNAYLSILPDSSYYNTYRFTGYKYANISGIDTGTFGLSQYTYTSILHDNKTEIDYDIYVYDSSTGTREDFITSQYYISTNIDNNIIYRTFDFGGNSNLYLTIILNDYTKYIDFDSDIYLFSPNTAYTHLSTPVECYNTEDISTCEHLATLPQNQQSFKDSNGNTVNESNPINYYDSKSDFFNQLDSLFGSNQSFKGLTGIISSPLNVIRNLTTSSTCTDIDLPIPYVNKFITLPCMSSIYSTYFGDFYTLYQSVTFAIIGYFVIIKFIATIKDLYNPDNDKIEVVDL